MAVWFLAGLLLLGGIVLLLRFVAYTEPRILVRIAVWGAALLGAGLLLFLLITGRFGFLWTTVFLFLPLLRGANRAWGLWRFWQRLKPATGASGGAHASAAKGPMTREEALAVLGLKPGVGRAEIIAAHRALMKNAHPDRGGSDWIAARLNEARDILLRADC